MPTDILFWLVSDATFTRDFIKHLYIYLYIYENNPLKYIPQAFLVYQGGKENLLGSYLLPNLQQIYKTSNTGATFQLSRISGWKCRR